MQKIPNNFQSQNINVISKKKIKPIFILIPIIIILVVLLLIIIFNNKNENSNNIGEEVFVKDDSINNINDSSETKIGEAKKISDNPGTINRFTFEMNGKKYEFNSKNNVYLYSYSQYKKTYEDQNGIINLVIDINNNPLRLISETDERINIKNISSFGKLIEEKNGVKIYNIDTDKNVEKYDIIWNDFLWTCKDIKRLKDMGISEKTLMESVYSIVSTIDEINSDNTVGELDDAIMQINVLNGYRFALREIPKYSYFVYYNVNSGNSKILKNSFSISYNINYNNTDITIDYENNNESGYIIYDNYRITDISFAGHKVYTYEDDLYYKNFIIVSEDKKSRLHIHPTSYGDMNKEDLEKILLIALEKK